MAEETVDKSVEKYRAELRDDVRHWIEAVQRREGKKRKRTERPLVVPPELPEGILRIAWVTDVVFGGNHHIPSPHDIFLGHRPYACFLIHERTIATFDFAEMTRLTVAAHEAGVRAQIGVGGFRELELSLHARERQGGMSGRHPELDQAVADLKRHRWAACPFDVPAGVTGEG
jgi:hypothetical protein